SCGIERRIARVVPPVPGPSSTMEVAAPTAARLTILCSTKRELGTTDATSRGCLRKPRRKSKWPFNVGRRLLSLLAAGLPAFAWPARDAAPRLSALRSCPRERRGVQAALSQQARAPPLHK